MFLWRTDMREYMGLLPHRRVGILVCGAVEGVRRERRWDARITPVCAARWALRNREEFRML
jgi:hypothetical protein